MADVEKRPAAVWWPKSRPAGDFRMTDGSVPQAVLEPGGAAPCASAGRDNATAKTAPWR